MEAFSPDLHGTDLDSVGRESTDTDLDSVGSESTDTGLDSVRFEPAATDLDSVGSESTDADLDSVRRKSTSSNNVSASITEARNAQIEFKAEVVNQTELFTSLDAEVWTQPSQEQAPSGQDGSGDDHSKGEYAIGDASNAAAFVSEQANTTILPSAPVPNTSAEEATPTQSTLSHHSLALDLSRQPNVLSLNDDDASFSLVEAVFDSLPLGLRLQHTDVPALILPGSGVSFALRVDSVRVAMFCRGGLTSGTPKRACNGFISLN